MEKIDLFKLHRADYVAAKSPVLCHIDKAHYLVINGKGAPGSDSFNDAVSALYAMAYTVKMTRKKNNLGDYVICKLEARYWSDGDQCLSQTDKSLWQWQLMIRTPTQVSTEDINQASKALLSKGKTPSVSKVSLIEHSFGQCVQMLHLGPYEEEQRTIENMLSFAAKQQLAFSGEHCEIYISDPRRIEPQRLKTVLRLPVS